MALSSSCNVQINSEPVYRRTGGYNNLTSNDAATQYYRQKIIQNTVRVKSSLYTMNLGALNVYQRPKQVYSAVDISGNKYVVSPGVNWNQMSDRKEPHIQQFTSGSNSSRVWRKTGPGAMSPGGSGVDIKHNSYERYLNRLKGKAPLRRGKIPDNFGINEIPYTRANPVYGSKIMKMSIVNDCNCLDKDQDQAQSQAQDQLITADYNIQDKINDIIYTSYNIESAPGTVRTKFCTISEDANAGLSVDSLYQINYTNTRTSFFNTGT